MKVKLAKALKIKNSLIARLNQLKNILQRENSRLVTSTSQVDRKKIHDQLVENMAVLIETKSLIAKANVGIYYQIEKMAELKSLITYYQSLDTTDGKVTKQLLQSTYIEEYTAHLKHEDIDKNVRDLQASLEKLQDEIDEYNSTNFVELPEKVNEFTT